MNTLKENKAILRRFMREHYTDEKLVQLLDHTRSGKLSYYSCCCFIGIPTSDHELKGFNRHASLLHVNLSEQTHYDEAKRTNYIQACDVEKAYRDLFPNWPMFKDSRMLIEVADNYRIRILIPMVLAELKRRTAVKVMQIA